MNRLIRLTTGQALVRFMARQYVERDREENRFIEGIWAILATGMLPDLVRESSSSAPRSPRSKRQQLGRDGASSKRHSSSRHLYLDGYTR